MFLVILSNWRVSTSDLLTQKVSRVGANPFRYSETGYNTKANDRGPLVSDPDGNNTLRSAQGDYDQVNGHK